MCHLEIAYLGVLIRFPNGSSVSFRKNDYGQLVEGEYCIVGEPTSADVRSARMQARLEVLERGYTVVH